MENKTVKKIEPHQNIKGKNWWSIHFTDGTTANTINEKHAQTQINACVEVELEKNGNYLNIKTINPIKIRPDITDYRTNDIHFQVCLKIASEQIKGRPEDLLNYANHLYYIAWKEP